MHDTILSMIPPERSCSRMAARPPNAESFGALKSSRTRLLFTGARSKSVGDACFSAADAITLLMVKGLCYFLFFCYYKYNTYFSDYQMVAENPLPFYE